MDSDIIQEPIGGTDPMTVKMKRILRFQRVAEEIMRSANILTDIRMKASLEFPRLLDLMCLALCH
jgi:hypothetical protein